MKREKVLEIFEKAGAMLTGHFLLTSGKHSVVYFEKFGVLQNPKATEELCREFAKHFKPKKIDVVVGAAIGGIILAYETAKHIGVRGIFMEREEGKLKFRRGFSVEDGERVLIVEDIVTTGGSVQEVIDELKANYKCEITGVAVLIDRSGKKIDFGVGETFSLAEVEVTTYDEKECPECKKGTPITKRGSRKNK